MTLLVFPGGEGTEAVAAKILFHLNPPKKQAAVLVKIHSHHPGAKEPVAALEKILSRRSAEKKQAAAFPKILIPLPEKAASEKRRHGFCRNGAAKKTATA